MTGVFFLTDDLMDNKKMLHRVPDFKKIVNGEDVRSY